MRHYFPTLEEWGNIPGERFASVMRGGGARGVGRRDVMICRLVFCGCGNRKRNLQMIDGPKKRLIAKLMTCDGDSGKRTDLLGDALKQPQIRDTQLASAKEDVPSILQSHVSEQNTMFWVLQLCSDGDVASIPVGNNIPFKLLLILIVTTFDRVSYQEFISRNKKKHKESKATHPFICSCWEAPCKG